MGTGRIDITSNAVRVFDANGIQRVAIGVLDVMDKDTPLTMYALDTESKVVATKEAEPYVRFNSAKKFFGELAGVHAVWVRYGDTWAVVHGAMDSWFIREYVMHHELPKPFQMYLMLLGE